MVSYYDTASASTWTTWTSTSASTYGTGDVWVTWTTGGTSTSSCATTSSAVRTIWTHQESYQRPVQDSQIDESYRQYLAQQKEELAKKQKQAEEAEIKAKELLLDLIGKDQMDVYERTGRLLVRGMASDYLIQKDGFVKKIEKDRIVDLCIHLREKLTVPKTDNVIALALLATADEYEFEKLANKHGSIQKANWTLPEAASF